MPVSRFSGVRRPIVIALALAGALQGSTGLAATITVSNLSDTSGNCRLRDAIASMNAGSDTGGCTAVVVPDGYGTNDTIEITGSGTLTLDAGNGELRVNDSANSLILRGAAGSSITLSGGATITHSTSNPTCSGGTRILRIDGRPTTVDNLTFTRGYAQDPFQNSNEDRQGGAIGFFPGNAPAGGNLTITSSAFTLNCADLDGGAVFAGDGAVSVTDSFFQNNITLHGRRGGGIHVEPEPGYGAHLYVTGSIFRANHGDGGGGGIGVRNAGATISSSEISGNHTADYGGGIYFDGGDWDTEYQWSVSNSTISGNTAGYYGGGMAMAGRFHAEVTNTTVTLNTAPYAGGLYLYGFFENLQVDPPRLDIRSTILAGNTASGPGLSEYRDIVVEPYNDPDYQEPVVYAQFLLVGVVPGLASIGDLGGNLFGTNASPINPRLAPLANNGGPTRTHALLYGSPALDTGNNLNALSFDQRGLGYNREMGAATDMGAYEAQVPPTASGGATAIPALGPLGLALLSLLAAAGGWLGLGRRR